MNPEERKPSPLGELRTSLIAELSATLRAVQANQAISPHEKATVLESIARSFAVLDGAATARIYAANQERERRRSD